MGNKYEMKLHPKYYNFILNGTKRIIIKLSNEKRKNIKVGDTIKFVKEPNFDESFHAKVKEIYKYDSYDEMFKDFNIDILADSSMTKEELIKVLERFNDKEKQNKYGVLGIKIDDIRIN